MEVTPKVSIVIACRNEEAFLEECLESIVKNDYPRERLEIFVVDGMSDDGTRQLIEHYGSRFPFIKCLENPGRIASTAFNLGIERASGDLIMIMGAHSVYATDYISRCVRASIESGAENVGGIIRVIPRTPGLIGKAIVAALSHQFGVGNAHFRCETGERKWVDTVFGGCYRREVFERIGKFNEELIFNQDIELNRRIGRAGGRILLDPAIVSEYQARSEWWTFCKHNFRNGSWVILSIPFSEGLPFSWRHLIPMLFVLSLVSAVALSFLIPAAACALLVIMAAYVLSSLAASATIAWNKRDIRFLAAMPFVFASLHISYGLGSLFSGIRMILGLTGEKIREARSGHSGSLADQDHGDATPAASKRSFDRLPL